MFIIIKVLKINPTNVFINLSNINYLVYLNNFNKYIISITPNEFHESKSNIK